MIWMVVWFVLWHEFHLENNLLNQIYNLVRKSCSKTSQYLVKNHNFGEMNLVDWEEDYKRKYMIFVIIIYQRNYKRIELWHSNHKLYHLGTAQYDIVLRNHQASLVHLELRSCASKKAETWCPYSSWKTYSLNENPFWKNNTWMCFLSS